MPAVFVFVHGGALCLQDALLSLCKSSNDLVYPSRTMITYWADSVTIKRSRNLLLLRLSVAVSFCLTLSHTHTCLDAHTQSHSEWIYIFLQLLYNRL